MGIRATAVEGKRQAQDVGKAAGATRARGNTEEERKVATRISATRQAKGNIEVNAMYSDWMSFPPLNALEGEDISAWGDTNADFGYGYVMGTTKNHEHARLPQSKEEDESAWKKVRPTKDHSQEAEKVQPKSVEGKRRQEVPQVARF